MCTLERKYEKQQTFIRSLECNSHMSLKEDELGNAFIPSDLLSAAAEVNYYYSFFFLFFFGGGGDQPGGPGTLVDMVGSPKGSQKFFLEHSLGQPYCNKFSVILNKVYRQTSCFLYFSFFYFEELHNEEECFRKKMQNLQT